MTPPPIARSAAGLYRALLVASVLVPAGVFVLLALQNRAEVLHEARDAIARTAAIMHEHARKVFETQELALGRVDDRVRGLSWAGIDRPEVSEFLRELKAPLEQAVSIWVADAAGTVRAGSQDWDRAVAISERDFFQAQRQRDAGTYVSQAFRGKATGVASFAVSRRRSTPDGRFDGTVHVALSPDYFARFFAEAAPALAHRAFLLRADGEVLAREPESGGGDRVRPDSPLMREIALRPDGGAFTGVSAADGRERMYAYRKVAGYPVYVALGIETAKVLGAWHENLAVYGAVTVGAALTLLTASLLALRRAQAEQAAAARLRSAMDRLRRESEQREAAEQKLRHAQRMEAVGQLTGGVAHDFNNLMTAILGNLELIERGAANPERVRRMAALARRAVERGAQLTSSLLAFSRRQHLRTESVDVNALLREFEHLIRRGVGEAVGLRLDLAPFPPFCRTDAAQLEAALLNLAINARDAMPDGGTLTLSTDGAELGPAELADNPEAQPGRFVAITVQDTGLGMAPEVIARAFEPFFTTKPVGQGTGLGLSQVFGFARQSGGHVMLNSAPGQGTAVTLFLPRSHEATATRPDNGPAPAVTALSAATVLLVEDDADVIEATGAALRDAGYRVITARNGPAAMAVLRSGEKVDVLFSDVVMPGGMNGIELVRQARALRPGLAALLTSGYAGTVAGTGEGECGFLVKPYRHAELAARLDALLTSPPAREGRAS